MKDTIEIEGWVVRSYDRDLTLFKECPRRNVYEGCWETTQGSGGLIELGRFSNAFPSLTWNDEPKKVKIGITME